MEECLRGNVPNVRPSDGLLQIALATLQQPQIERESRYEFYFVCFSEHSDQLSQWRAYAQDASGYAVGFSKEVLRNDAVLDQLHSDNLGDTVDLLKVIYDSGQQAAMFDRLIQKVRDRVDKLMPNLPDFLRKGAIVAANTLLVSSLLRMALHFKHHGFNEEEEWRLILCKSKSGIDAKPTDFPVLTRVTSFGITPYVSIPLCRTNEQLTIEHVVIGPKSNSAKVDKHFSCGLDTLFRQLANGKPTKGVVNSGIPYR